MDQMHQTTIPHLVQVYQPSSVTTTKLQNPQIIHIAHPSSQGEVAYHQTITSEACQIPVSSQITEIQMTQNQIVMSCHQGIQGLPLQSQSQVLQSSETHICTSSLPLTSHVIVPQHVLVNGVQSYYGQFGYPKPEMIATSPHAVKKESFVSVPETPHTKIVTAQVKMKSRSHIPDPKKWACNVRKLKHQRGEAYISRRGKYVPERQIKIAKDCSCRFNCNTKISNTDREHIFKAFYTLDANEKRHFLLNTTERLSIKHTKVLYSSKRKYSFKYFFTIKSEKYPVCKNFYLATLAISQKPVYNVHMGKSDLNMPKRDGRGHSTTSTHSLPNEDKDRIRKHILSFKTIDSKSILQYSKKKQYLGPHLSIKKMYEMYVDVCNKNGAVGLKESMYRKIFKLEFNLHFKKVKIEASLCVRCKGDIKKNS